MKSLNLALTPYVDAWRKATLDSVFKKEVVIAETITQESKFTLPAIPKKAIRKMQID
jgi:hypothetical protein